jgi:hypothetical protein
VATRKGKDTKKMAQYGISIMVDEGKQHGYGTPYSFVVDRKEQVRELLLGTTAPITEVIVTEEAYGQETRMMTAEEILGIVLNHPKPALSLA